METANKYFLALWIIAWSFLITIHQARAQDDVYNHVVGYSAGPGITFVDLKTEKQTINWSASVWRNLGARLNDGKRGGDFYFGLDASSKVQFRVKDSLGTNEYLRTPFLDLGFGFSIQNNLSTRYAGRIMKFGVGIPLENMKEYKLHLAASMQLNINPGMLIGTQETIGFYVELGADGLLMHRFGEAQRLLWSPKVGVGVNLLIPGKEQSY